jgi:hypothetical protein
VRKTMTVIAAAGLALALLTMSGCVMFERVDRETEDDREVVELDGAERLEADIRMGAGRLTVKGGAEEAMDARFRYDVSSMAPEVDYETDDDAGYLTVRQPSGRFSLGDTRYEWDVALADSVPLDLDLDLGAGEATLDLRDTMLEELTVEVGAGDLAVDLSGDYDESVDVRMKGGAGRLTLTVPRDMGVRVQIDGGIGTVSADGFISEDGDWINEAYRDRGDVMDIEIDGGVGDIVLKMED